MEMKEERRARLDDAATKRLRLAMEMDEERKARLEKMVATTQLRLAIETEEIRRARLENDAATGWPWRRTKKEKQD